MKQLSELGISPTPWRIIPYGESTSIKTPILGDVESNEESIYGDGIARFADARLIAAAPKMYEALRQSTNAIEHVIQFVKNKYIKDALRKLADNNKAVLAEAGGEK